MMQRRFQAIGRLKPGERNRTDAPSEEQLLESLHTNVMGEVSEFFSFAPDEDAE